MRKHISPAVHAFAGTVAGLCALSLTYPLQTVSMLQQVDRGSDVRANIFLTVLRLAKLKGWGRLYAGLGFALIGQVCSQYYFFYLFVLFRKMLMSSMKGFSRDIIASVVAGVLSTVLANPLWLANARACAQPIEDDIPSTPITEKAKRAFGGLFQALRQIVEENGLSGLMIGLGPSLVLVTNPVICYTTSERLKFLIMRLKHGATRVTSSLSPHEVFAVGAVAKCVATLVTYPYFMARTRVQAHRKLLDNPSEDNYTATDYIRDTIKQEGFFGLYRGMESKMTQSVLTASLLYFFHERLAHVLHLLVAGSHPES
jgi:solute carrier family 25 (peroxisomal adenine nucleotide transporter), member 17